MIGSVYDLPDIPPILLRDASNQSELIKMAQASTRTKADEAKPNKAVAAKATAKALNGADKAKPAKSAAKAKTAPVVTAKATKAKPAPKAKAESKVALDKYGYREGSMKSKAAALYARKEGATLEEVKTELGSVQLNCLTELEAEGYTVKKTKEERDEGRAVTRYFLKGKAAA